MQNNIVSQKTSNLIFILGIRPRSGTNFFYDLIRKHPGCQPGPIWEDHIIFHSYLLDMYVQYVSNHFQSECIVSKDELYQSLGAGLASLLSVQGHHNRIVTKTPHVKNIKHFFKLFPEAYLLILVRDGRSVVESGLKSLNWDFETAVHAWAEAARTIIEFDQLYKNTEFKYKIVRYEDLYIEPRKVLIDLFDYLQLSIQKYDFTSAENLPVRGSSTLAGKGVKAMHWQPVEKTVDFNPLERWSYWSRARHERFNWIAGKYLTYFGYEKKVYSANRFLWNTWGATLNTALTAKSASARKTKSALQILKWSLRIG